MEAQHAAQHAAQPGGDYFWLGVGVAFVLMMMAGTVLNGVLKDRGYGAVGNGFCLFVGLALGVMVMRGFQTYF